MITLFESPFPRKLNPMSNQKLNPSLMIATALVIIVAFYGATQFNNLRPTEYVEIRDYQGVRLSSIGDFRENSIKGPQEVNITDYRLMVYGEVASPVERRVMRKPPNKWRGGAPQFYGRESGSWTL